MEQLELKSRVDAIRALDPALSIRAACAQAGVNHANYLRWTRVVESGGPRAAKKMGRPRVWQWTEKEALCLKWFNAWSESFALAVEYLIQYGRTGEQPLGDKNPNPHPRPGAELTDRLYKERARGGRWDARLPKDLRDAAALTEAERRHLRGQKQYNDVSLSTRRLMVIRDFNPLTGLPEDIEMWAGCGFCSDDCSVEQPFVSMGEDGQERVNRQTLFTVDVYSLRGLANTCLAREGDAYTKVDQADHIAAVVAEHGLPYYWAFERGPWQNDFIDGVKLETGWCEDMERWGGLDGLFKVRHKFKPQHKVIEGWLHHLQRRMRGRGLTLRSVKRGEYERATKIMTAAQKGNAEALAYMMKIGEVADALYGQMEARNETEQSREFLDGATAKPNDLWSLTYQRRELAAGDAWRLLPIKECRVMVKGRISVTLKGYGTFEFACVSRGELPLMDNGHRLLCAFHPGRPEEGAQLFNGDLRRDYNRDGMKFGEALGAARYLPPAVMEDFTGTGDYSAQRRARQAVTSELRLVKCQIGGVGLKVSRRADSRGRSLTISNEHDEATPSRRTKPEPAPLPRRATVPSITDLMDEPASVTPSRISREVLAEACA